MNGAVRDAINAGAAFHSRAVMKTVRYTGRRPFHKDALYGTGEWVSGQTKRVDDATAFKMLRHHDVFVASPDDVSAEVVSAPAVVDPDRQPHMSEDVLAAIDAINSMGTDAIASFVRENFQQKIDRRKSVENLRIDATRMLHQFGLAS